jgi:hypothetical protein
MTIKNCFTKADLGITLEYDVMEIDETENFHRTDFIMEIGNIMTQDLDIFIKIDNYDSEEFIQVNLRDIEEDLVLQENNTLEDTSVEENLEMNKKPSIYSLGRRHFTTACVSYKTTCTTLMLLNLQIINMKMIGDFEQFNNSFRKANHEQ